MKEEVAIKWVEALRSGKYEQTDGRLRKTDGFCCLGVLCDISGISEWEKDTAANCFSYGFGARDELPTMVKNWAGMFSTDATLDDPIVRDIEFEGEVEEVRHDNLADANDSGMTFEEIADYIEKHWAEL